MQDLFGFLIFGALAFFIVNLFKPGILGKLLKKDISRAKGSLGILGAIIGLFVLFGISSPSTVAQPEVQGVTNVQEQNNETKTSPKPAVEPKIQ